MGDYKSVGWIEDIFKGFKSDWKTADRSILDIVKNVGEMNQLFPSQEDNLMNETLRGDDHRSLLRLEKILLNADGRKRVKRKILEDVDKLMNRENKGSRQEMDKKDKPITGRDEYLGKIKEYEHDEPVLKQLVKYGLFGNKKFYDIRIFIIK